MYLTDQTPKQEEKKKMPLTHHRQTNQSSFSRTTKQLLKALGGATLSLGATFLFLTSAQAQTVVGGPAPGDEMMFGGDGPSTPEPGDEMGGDSVTVTTPEPTLTLGLITLGGLMLGSKRKSKG